MLFKVEMVVRIPPEMPADTAEQIKREEKQYAQRLQEQGVWRHLWRVAGQYANVSIFDVESNEALHNLLTQLPLYPYMEVTVTPLCRHPSSIHPDDR
ncbi:muconolactone Delta-isomerase [Nissabacter sp. SGAir0207]|uniref:muconolactone Delta-isomerase n=1 Tax=Nissabacter sp. SGAir0207 TaxID=2126321 RepID=UPI0010CD4F3A|nr:muconolactone Delta-isomerase [Nissabacter sp. SGAir0207]QCR38326.1 muconolactone delta-isomerase [Nissabacter sp. SGAir0207]